MGGEEYISKMDQQLPEATILLFRRLAHAKVTNLPLLTLPHIPYFLNTCCLPVLRWGFPLVLRILPQSRYTSSIMYHEESCKLPTVMQTLTG